MNNEKLENICAAIAISHNNLERINAQLAILSDQILETDHILWKISEELKEFKNE